MRIVMPGSWSLAWSLPLHSNEIRIALKSLKIKNQTDQSTQSFIAVGTSIVLGAAFVFEMTVDQVDRGGLSDIGEGAVAGISRAE